MAGTFNFRYKEKYQSKTCVVKYWFGTKYFIWKALHLKQSCDQVFRDLNNKLAKEKLKTLSEDDLFYLVAKYVNRYPATTAIVEVVFESDDHQAILDFDKKILTAVFQDPNCLNICCDQYIPGWLKASTQNKPLQSIKNTPLVQSIAPKVETKPDPARISVQTKSEPVESPVFDTGRIFNRIKTTKTDQ